MKRLLDWKLTGTHSTQFGIPLGKYQAVIGADPEGTEWLVEVDTDDDNPAQFWICFDKNVEDEDGTPFLRESVLDAYDYWGAKRERYHMEVVEYCMIRPTIDRFCNRYNIR